MPTTPLLRTLLSLPLLAAASLLLAEAPKESDYYVITPIPTPEGALVETSGIELMPDGKVAVCTRRGEVWMIENAREHPATEAKWTAFARYLHEPLGLSYRDGWLYATQRPEVTRMKDLDGDGRADVFESVNSGWGITGDYHEYAFGTRHDPEGNLYAALCLTGSFSSNTAYRGWTVKITPEGELEPFASGIRSPGGIGYNAQGDLFYTDNQGTWNGSSSVKHLAYQSFQGNPNGLIWHEIAGEKAGEKPAHPPYDRESRTVVERENIANYVPPAVMLPHGKIGQSPTAIVADMSDGRFGPFAGQTFVGEQTHSQVQRLFFEKVNGVYQGAAFHFLSGFASGTIGMRLGDDGILWAGGSNRGWGARGGQKHNFERVNWNGKMPFEVLEMRVQPDGFELEFTQPADVDTLKDAASYTMQAYTYKYHKEYGSPEVDLVEPKLSVASVSADGTTVRLIVDPMTKGHVHELDLHGVRNADGFPLLHKTAYYTLNEIPE